ncbi:uncharacterized protein A4U43_C01F23460 [Asparagus officinalis]|uniref:Uncharacterized protein n=1 Tax=Asparagus officinalis TaxID=4686 RepID=A0A5P1FRJ1_ASPOF|nr:uncharacterized protein A4U43_C01F23460 [Asparagus officinalis]
MSFFPFQLIYLLHVCVFVNIPTTYIIICLLNILCSLLCIKTADRTGLLSKVIKISPNVNWNADVDSSHKGITSSKSLCCSVEKIVQRFNISPVTLLFFCLFI